MTTFRYTDQQWAHLIHSAGAGENAFDREAMELECGRVMRLKAQHEQISVDERARLVELMIGAVEAIEILPPSEDNLGAKAITAEYLLSVVANQSYLIGVDAGSANRSKSTMHRDVLIDYFILKWRDAGRNVGVSKNRDGGQPYGPLIRFVQAGAEPALGSVSGNAVEAAVRRARSGVKKPSVTWVLGD